MAEWVQRGACAVARLARATSAWTERSANSATSRAWKHATFLARRGEMAWTRVGKPLPLKSVDAAEGKPEAVGRRGIRRCHCGRGRRRAEDWPLGPQTSGLHLALCAGARVGRAAGHWRADFGAGRARSPR